MKKILLLLFFLCYSVWAKETLIMALHSYNETYPWTKEQRTGFRDVVNSVPGLYPLYSSEYLDTKRRSFDEAYENDFLRYLQSKYKGYRPEIIYVTDDNALKFMVKHREELFPGVPVLFSGINDLAIISTLPKESYTGIYENKEFFPNLRLIKKLFPEKKEILVIGDGSETANAIELAVQKEKLRTPTLKIRSINDRHFDFILKELKAFKGDAVILTTVGSFRTEEGHLISLMEVLDQIIAAGTYHTFSMESSYVQRGVLGGYAVDGVLTGRAIGELALEILSHPKSPLPQSTVNVNHWMFDAEVLKQHNLTLPQNIVSQSTFLNAPHSFYQKHETLITYFIYGLVATIITGSLLFIRYLYLSRKIIAKRESELVLLSESLNKAQELAHLGNWTWNIQTNTLWWSDEIYRIFGLLPQEFPANYEAFLLQVHPDDRDAVQEAVTHTLTHQTDYSIIHRIVQKDGTVRRVLEEGQVEYKNDKPLKMTGTVQDITEDFEKEEALLFQSQIFDAVQDSIIVHDLEGNFLYLNENAWKTRGYTREEMMSMKLSQLDAPEFLSGHPEMMKAAVMQMAQEGSMQIQVEHLCKNGDRLPVEVYAKLITLNHKQYVLSSVRDISAQKEAQKVLEKSEEKYKNLVEHAMVGIYRSDLSGNVLYVNQTLAHMFGYDSPDELTKQKSLIHYTNLKQRVAFIQKLSETHFVNNYELDLLDHHSNPLPVLISATLDGNILSGMIIDMREIKKSREEVDKLSKVVEQIDDAVMITDKKGNITYVNYAFCEHTGFSREEVLGNNPRILKSGKHDQAFYKNLWKIILHGNIFRFTITNRKKNGDIFYENKTITPLKDEKDNITGFVSSGKDVTLETMMHQDMERIATIDKLTGIYNRHKFEEIFALEAERSRRFGQPLSLILIDIDHFKAVNDTYGHDIGDEVLKHLVMIVQENIRKIDIFARWGGEEFLILSPGTDLENLQILAEKLRVAVERSSFPKTDHITISLGISTHIENDTFLELFKRADQGLYHAKEHGRNQIGIITREEA